MNQRVCDVLFARKIDSNHQAAPNLGLADILSCSVSCFLFKVATLRLFVQEAALHQWKLIPSQSAGQQTQQNKHVVYLFLLYVCGVSGFH